MRRCRGSSTLRWRRAPSRWRAWAIKIVVVLTRRDQQANGHNHSNNGNEQQKTEQAVDTEVLQALGRQRELRPAAEHHDDYQRKRGTEHHAEYPTRSPNPTRHNGERDEHQYQIEQRSGRIGEPPDASVEREEQLEEVHGRG